MTACSFDNYKSVKLLLAYKADPNIKLSNGWTAIDGAAANKNIKLIQLLLEYNAEINTAPRTRFETEEFETNYFLGHDGKDKQWLTFETDSTFHITIPMGGGCRRWGEHGSSMKFSGSIITFDMTFCNQSTQLFLITDSETIKKISVGGFMCDVYKLKKLKK